MKIFVGIPAEGILVASGSIVSGSFGAIVSGSLDAIVSGILGFITGAILNCWLYFR